MLMPESSGAPGAAITFGSYGDGRATLANGEGAVWFSGKRFLTFRDLVLTTGGSASGVFASSPGAPSTNIVLRDSLLQNTRGTGVSSANPGDSDWTVSGNTIRDIGDSGILTVGRNETFTGNTITQTGTNTALDYAKHGIYAKGPDLTIAGNDFSRNLNGQAISIRFHGARVTGNRIHDTAYAIAFFDYDTAPAPQGTSYIQGNKLWNITGYGFYYDNQLDPNGKLPTVDFVLTSNTFSFANASEAVNVAPSRSAHVTITNNIFTGSFGSALRAASTTVEHHNLWHGFTSNKPAGAADVFTAPSPAVLRRR
jgi:hypothetical protein